MGSSTQGSAPGRWVDRLCLATNDHDLDALVDCFADCFADRAPELGAPAWALGAAMSDAAMTASAPPKATRVRLGLRDRAIAIPLYPTCPRATCILASASDRGKTNASRSG